MRWRSIALLAGGLAVLLSSLSAFARLPHSGARAAHGGNCVAFARELTGIHLDGNAAAWWPHAEGRYDRGHAPSVGAILVFKPYGRMRVGHVAVVARVVGPREVLVDQANWVRGRVTKAMSVVDASPLNDWTSVKVLEPHSGTHGRENPTYGFIYPRVLPASFEEAAAEPSPIDRHDDGRTAHAAKRPLRDSSRIASAEPGPRDRAPVVRGVHAAGHPGGGEPRLAHVHATGHATPSLLAAPDIDMPEDHLAADAPRHPGHKAKIVRFAGVY